MDSKSRIIVEVDIAYKNRTKVEGYIAPNTTVYPLQ